MPKQGLSLLAETSVRTAKPKDKPYLLRDGGGLWLVVEPSGRKWWKMRVVFAKKENSFSLGEYPTVSLSAARGKREALRKQIAEGIDPGAVRKAEKVREAGEGSFETVAREWHKRFSAKWSAGHAETILHRLEKDVFPYIGQRAIAEITPPEVLNVLRRIEERSLETAHRVKYSCGQIFRYAVSTGHATIDPVSPLRDALPPIHNKHMAAPTDPKAIAPLLRMISTRAREPST